MYLPTGEVMPHLAQVSIVPEDKALEINNTPPGRSRRGYPRLVPHHINLAMVPVHRIGINIGTSWGKRIANVEVHIALARSYAPALLKTYRFNLDPMDLH